MDKIDVAGLKIDALTKNQFLEELQKRLDEDKKTFIITPYSEFLYSALQNKELMELFNSADIAVPDGIGVIWAQYFLSRPFHIDGFWGRVLQAWGQVASTGAQILLNPKKLYQVFPEKLVGADLIWDLAGFAAKNNLKVFLAGGFGETPEKVKTLLQSRFANLQIVGTANTGPKDRSILDSIENSGADMLLVAFGPIKQEKWIAQNLPNLPAKIAIGLGGTFDYLVGEKKSPPKFIRESGLEWFYRLFTQPSRAKRIYQAFGGLIISLVRHKVFHSFPLRENGMAVVVNKENQILVCKRAVPSDRASQDELTSNNYWQFPQGGLDEGESVVEGTKRELREETGMRKVDVLAVSQFTNFYFWKNAKRSLLFSHFHNPGQQQHTVFFKYRGDDSDIELDTDELIDFEWLPIEEAVARVAEERQDYARIVINELAELLKNK